MTEKQDFDLTRIAQTLVSDGPFRYQPAQRRVRGLFNNKYAFDTLAAYHVWERPYRPMFFIPATSFTPDATLTKTSPVDGTENSAYFARLTVGNRSTTRVVIFVTPQLKDLVMINFTELDQWFEEDERIYGQPKDPYKRIDILRSSRTVQVSLAGVILAKSRSPHLLLETSLPPRYYLRSTDVKWEYLRESTTETYCPYKGTAIYYDVDIKGVLYKDLVWCYPSPVQESVQIAGCVCFYNEKVDFRIDIPIGTEC